MNLKNLQTLIIKHIFNENFKSLKVKNENDLCRKCGTNVIKKQPKKKPAKAGQTYYYEYYLFCPNCKTQYMIEEAKRGIVK